MHSHSEWTVWMLGAAAAMAGSGLPSSVVAKPKEPSDDSKASMACTVLALVATLSPQCLCPWRRRPWRFKAEGFSTDTDHTSGSGAGKPPAPVRCQPVRASKTVQRRLGLRTAPGPDRQAVRGRRTQRHHHRRPGDQRTCKPLFGQRAAGPQGMPVGGRHRSLGRSAGLPAAGSQRHRTRQPEGPDGRTGRAAGHCRPEGETLRTARKAQCRKRKSKNRTHRGEALRQRRNFGPPHSIDSAVPLRAPVSGVPAPRITWWQGRSLMRAKSCSKSSPRFQPSRHWPTNRALPARCARPAPRQGDAALELRFVGGGRQLREQALPLAVSHRQPQCCTGSRSTGQGGRRAPSAASRAQRCQCRPSQLTSGETAVWVHAGPERFVARKIRTQPLDAVNIAVIDGLY